MNDENTREAVGFTPFTGPIREVSSDSNPTFKLCRDVLTGRGIRKHGVAILAGARQVAEVLEHFPDRAEAWLTGDRGMAPPRPGVTWLRLSEPLFKELDAFGTKSPLLLVKVPDLPNWSDEDVWPAGCTLFVPFQDPENVGAVIRSAAAFGAARVVLLREAAPPVSSQKCPRRRPGVVPGSAVARTGLVGTGSGPCAAHRLVHRRPRARRVAVSGALRTRDRSRRTGLAAAVSRGERPSHSDRGGGRVAERGDRDGHRALRLARESFSDDRMSGAFCRRQCLRASRIRCGSSGRMILVIASSTAAREPGMTKRATLPIKPPTARLSMHAGPISA